jgi:hypothetical protein
MPQIAAHGSQIATKAPETTKTQPSQFDAKLQEKAPISQTPLSNIVQSIETGGLRVDALIKTSLSGKNMSNGELLAMQAGLYRYTQELDLCSKVVDKAVNGLRDVLKTQV